MEKMNPKNIGRNLKFIMEALEINQSELAEKTGLTPAAISQIINGNRLPSLDSMVAILEVIPTNFERLCK